jgi:DNA polymerase I
VELLLINNINDILPYERELLSASVIAIDTETTGLDPHKDKIRLIQLAAEALPVFVIDCRAFLPEGLPMLKKIILSKSVKVFQNAKFDMQFLMALEISPPAAIFDTMLAALLLRSSDGPQRVGLEELVRHYLGESLPKDEQKSDWSGDLRKAQLEYAAKDAEVLLRLRKKMVTEIKQNNLVETARQEFSCARAIAQVEFNGIHLDLCRWRKLTEKIESEQQAALVKLYEYAGQPKVQVSFFGDKILSDINMDSNKQILNILRSNGIPVSDTSRHTLGPYSHNPLVQAITEYRRTAKLLSTFLYSIPQQIHPVTGRLHPKYSQIGAWSGRMSCGGPNIQQIPRDKHFRACFSAEEGKKLVIADYSQIELRVVAEISRDERMITAYRNGEDLHRLTASLISGKPIEEVTKGERQSAKAMNFGLVFAMGAKGLQTYAKETYDVDMTLEDAEQFRNRFFHAYKGVAAWHKWLKTNPPAQSRTVAGRKHVYGGQGGLSGLCNTPVQGSAADIIKNALGKLVDRLGNTNTKIIAVVHDEVVLETKCEQADEVARILKETMESAGAEYLKLVPLLAEVQIADSWAEK